MTSLIEQLEQADGPSDHLDRKIRDHVLGDGVEHFGFTGYANYTSSVDAALSRVPEGMRRRVMVMEDSRASVQLCLPGDGWPDAWGKLYANEAIATVIAALKAQSGDEE